MIKREILNLDLKIKLTKDYLENGGIEKIWDAGLLEDLTKVKSDPNGKVDHDTISTRVNAFMIVLLDSHLSPPLYHPEYISEYASTLQKSYSFYQDNIDTVEHFDKMYEVYKVKKDTLFRGLREAKWRLYSKLQVKWLTDRLFEKEESYQKFIEKLVEIGKAEFSVQIKELLNIHHIDTENDISILGYLQHHGCPTPLLDWTYRFQNALYFSIDGLISNPRTIEIENYFSVYYIEEKHFESSNFRTIIDEGLSDIEQPLLLKIIAEIAKDENQKKEMERHFADRKLFDRQKISGSGLITYMTKIEHLLGFPLGYFSDKDVESGILFSLNNSKNILNQAGVFTWNAEPSKPIEMVGDEQYRENKSEVDAKYYRFCSCFNIHKKLAGHVRNRLEADGITKEFIYPTPEVSTWEVFEKSKK